MRTKIVFYFNANGEPIGCKVACDNEQQGKKLHETARRMMLAAIEGPHACKCGRNCWQEK